MSKTVDRTVLITGATDGIGLALARHYEATGARLVLIGRRALNDLEDALFDAANYCQVDLSRHDCAEQVVSWLDEQQIQRLDLVIHNAGVGYVGALENQSAENITQLVAVNLKAPVALTHHLLPHVEAVGGQFAYISSVASVLPGPDYAVYSATKAALDGFVRNFQIELAATGSPASAHLIHPGATRTGMHAKSGATADQIDPTRFPSAEDVAAQIVTIIERGSRRRAVGFSNRLGLAAGRTVPNVIEGMLRRKVADAPDDDAQDDDMSDDDVLDDGEPGTETNAETNAGTDSRHCVITGAADGIGRALALAYAAAGFTITGIDLDRDRSMRTQAEIINAGGRGRFLIADLASEADLLRVGETLAQRPPIDVLIHNAGISAVGPFQTQPLPPQMAVLDVNLLAPLQLTAGLLRQERLARSSTIIFMSSLSHFVGYPGAAAYAASKDGVTSFASSLSVGLKSQGVDILTVFPGPTRTAHARRYSPDNASEGRRMPPEKLATSIFRASQQGKRVLIPGVGNRVFAAAGRFFPGPAEQAMRKVILDKMIERG